MSSHRRNGNRTAAHHNLGQRRAASIAETTGTGTVQVDDSAVNTKFINVSGAAQQASRLRQRQARRSSNAAGDMSTLDGADYGIQSTGTTGAIGVTMSGDIGAVGAGVNVAGISVVTASAGVGAPATAISINSTGNIYEDASGLATTYNIKADNGAGTGAIYNPGACWQDA